MNKKFKIILAVISIILVLLVVWILSKNYLNEKINESVCEKRGGFWGGEGVCLPYNNPIAAQKNIFGIDIKIPGEENKKAKITSKIGEEIKGEIIDIKTEEKIGGEVIAYPEKIKSTSNRLRFVMPFEINYGEKEKYFYLGLFSFSEGIMEDDYKFYKEINHIDSYFVGKNILLDKFEIDTDGIYEGLFYGATSDLIKMNYYLESDQSNKQETEVKLYKSSPYFELSKNCEEVGQVIKKKRGDGKEYSICLFKNGNQCELGSFNRRMCTRGGYDVSGKNEVETYAILNDWFYLIAENKYISPDPNNRDTCTIQDYFNGKCE